MRAAVLGSGVSGLPSQPPQSQWGIDILAPTVPLSLPCTFLRAPCPRTVEGVRLPPPPVAQGSSGGFRAADPPPAVTASPQVQRRLPLPAHGPQRLPAEPKAAAFEAT